MKREEKKLERWVEEAYKDWEIKQTTTAGTLATRLDCSPGESEAHLISAPRSHVWCVPPYP
jgi:hypothetical protein